MNDFEANFEPLPGYRLIERLGSGGYGEVWRAEAPGGLTKAIKFVFGTQHEKRASNELRALDHVRGVRHPFLLSLERIEVVDGRLLVVTELADKSLKDRFDLCRRDGLRGVPRDELLGYLRDAADALDFMSDSHALQHLDIKPENLLLLAGHVKVADFGLVKDVRQSQASLVGGMTPLYAAPEVFRGTPSRHSDQYSLAIVYQEMLSGTLPFAGSNAAELTLQHLNDEPDLSALAIADRYAVSRALSKDPQHRYTSCRDFVESLIRATAIAKPSGPELGAAEFGTPSQYTGEGPQKAAKTEFFDDGDTADWQSPPQLLAELPPSDCRIVDLPPVDITGRDVRPIPTLVLGIGGTAGRVLAQLRRMIHEQFSGNRVPAVQFLLLDTDTRTQSGLADRESVGLTADEMLNLPLRRPQHYRDNSQQLLHWISRRWLYNIPRSLRTEGLRPLGRLALADHARQAGQRIRRAMASAVDGESITASNVTTGHAFRPRALRVIVVASISGGTGGGMSLDIGYAVRAILQKMGLAEASVIGIMMHSTNRDARHSELAKVNAFSWLSEFNHFQQPASPYPGDDSCGLPGHPAGVAAFDQTYLLHLGENLDTTEFDQTTQIVAEYLRFDTLTSAGAYLDACRNALPKDDKSGQATSVRSLRSFGLSQRMAASREFCDNFAGVISRHVLSSWVGADRNKRPTTTAELPGTAAADATASVKPRDPECVQIIGRLKLDAAGIEANSRALVELQLGTDATSFLSDWQKKLGSAGNNGVAKLQAIDQMFSGRYEGAVDGELSILGKRTPAIVAPLAEKLRSEIRRWITRRIDDPRQRLAGARRAVQGMSDHLVELLNHMQQRQSSLASKANKLNDEVRVASGNSAAAGSRSRDAAATLSEYFTVCLDRVGAFAAQSAISLLLSDVKALSDEVTALSREIDQITSAVGRAAQPCDTDSASGGQANRADSETRLAADLIAKLPEIAAQVDAQLQAGYIEAAGGLANTIMQGGRPRAQLTAKLHELSRQAVYHALAGVDVLKSAVEESSPTSGRDLKSSLALATPALLEFGGTRRVLAILPRDAAGAGSQNAIAQQLGTPVTAITGTDSSLTLCVEADGLSLPHIALEFVERRRDRVDFAGRVHCRTDITWTPLIATTSQSDSALWASEEARRTQSQNAMCKTVVL